MENTNNDVITDDENLEEGEITDEEQVQDEVLEKEPEKSRTKRESESRYEFQAFMKKKREELQEKVKSQLQLAGVSATVEEGLATDPECVLPDSLESKLITADPVVTVRKKNPLRYRDLDPKPSMIGDPTETMINSWLSGKKSAKSGRETRLSSGEVEINDPYLCDGERLSPNADAVLAAFEQDLIDKDYRLLARQPAIEDAADALYYSGRRHSHQSELRNEFGDRDYRQSERSANRRRDERDRYASRHVTNRSDHVTGRSSDRRRRRFSDDDAASEFDDGDVDWRRGASRSSIGDRKRPRLRPRPPSPTSPPRRRIMAGRNWDKPMICKFFREGYCRDSDNCSFSHNAADSQRAPELCHFYRQGHCQKGLNCPFLHGEFPCQAFHKGACAKGQFCPYSHAPLNDYSSAIVEQMVKEEEASLAAQPTTKRKTLLPAPAIENPRPSFAAAPINTPPHHTPHQFHPERPHMLPDPEPPFQHQPQTMPQQPPADEFGYSEVETSSFSRFDETEQPTPASGPIFAPRPMFPQFMVPPPTLAPSLAPNLAPMAQLTEAEKSPEATIPKAEVRESPKEEPPKPTPTFNIHEMLQKIKAQVKGEEDVPEESPASPPPQSQSKSEHLTPQKIPSQNPPRYRLIVIEVKKGMMDPALLKASLTDTKLRNDPRIKGLLVNQFNAVSRLIQKQKFSKSNETGGKSKSESAKTAARDPRINKQPAETSTVSETGALPSPTALTMQNPVVSMQNLQDIINQRMTAMSQPGSMPGVSTAPVGLMPPTIPSFNPTSGPTNGPPVPPKMPYPPFMPGQPPFHMLGQPHQPPNGVAGPPGHSGMPPHHFPSMPNMMLPDRMPNGAHTVVSHNTEKVDPFGWNNQDGRPAFHEEMGPIPIT